MSHSTQINIKIGGFSTDVEVTLEYGSRAPSVSYGVEVGRPKTFTNNHAMSSVLDTLQMHGYGSLIAALYEQAEFAQRVYGDEKGIDWLTITINHFD